MTLSLRTLLPLGVFAVIAVALAVGLTLNPRVIPSALIDQPVPQFDLPPLEASRGGLSTDDLSQGQVSVINVWASWCGPCRVEHPVLMELQARNVARVHGINYKDGAADAKQFLALLGDPYERVGVDREGRAAIDWGVYGVPETFVVDGRGHIVLKHVGPLSPRDLEEKILPAIEEVSR